MVAEKDPQHPSYKEKRTLSTTEQKIDELEVKLDTHITETRELFNEVMQMQKGNADNILANTAQIAGLTEATKGLVEAWTAANALHRFIKWISGFAIVGVIVAWGSGKINAMNLFGG